MQLFTRWFAFVRSLGIFDTFTATVKTASHNMEFDWRYTSFFYLTRRLNMRSGLKLYCCFLQARTGHIWLWHCHIGCNASPRLVSLSVYSFWWFVKSCTIHRVYAITRIYFCFMFRTSQLDRSAATGFKSTEEMKQNWRTIRFVRCVYGLVSVFLASVTSITGNKRHQIISIIWTHLWGSWGLKPWNFEKGLSTDKAIF